MIWHPISAGVHPLLARVPSQQVLFVSRARGASAPGTAAWPQLSGYSRWHSCSHRCKRYSEAAAASSKNERRDLLRFVLPALGISLSGPILSNIDNAFVGHFEGAGALAALSPGTLLADNVVYLLVFLPRATVGLVSRAYAAGGAEGAQRELSRVLSVALPIGIFLSILFVTCSPYFLQVLRVAPGLRGRAAAYAQVRGLGTWAALTQGVCLSALLAAGDALTPLKVVGVTSLANVLGDFVLCAWPLRLGVVGAAGSTTAATVLGCALMARGLWRRGFMPRQPLRLPTSMDDMKPLLQYAGPLFMVVLCRFLGLASMALTAARLGNTALAAYQVVVNILLLFGLFGEPLSQAAQARLPPLLDKGDTSTARRRFSTLLSTGILAGLLLGSAASAFACLGGCLFTKDLAVLAAVARSAPALMVTVGFLVVAYPIDGAMLAAKKFGSLISLSILGVLIQFPMLVFLVAGVRRGILNETTGLVLLLLSLALRLITLSGWSLSQILQTLSKT